MIIRYVHSIYITGHPPIKKAKNDSRQQLWFSRDNGLCNAVLTWKGLGRLHNCNNSEPLTTGETQRLGCMLSTSYRICVFKPRHITFVSWAPSKPDKEGAIVLSGYTNQRINIMHRAWGILVCTHHFIAWWNAKNNMDACLPTLTFPHSPISLPIPQSSYLTLFLSLSFPGQ